MSAFAVDFDGAPRWKVEQRRQQARKAREVFAEWSKPCRCGHRIGDHAAFKDRERGRWPCTADGCPCLARRGRSVTVPRFGSVPSEVAQLIATEIRLERAFGSNQLVIALTVQQVLERLVEHVGCGVFRWRDFPTSEQPVAEPVTGRRTDEERRTA